MKRLNFIIMLFLGLIIMSCSSDDDSDNTNNVNDIVGEWKLIRSLDFENGQLTEHIEGDCVQQSLENFSENGTYSFIYYGLPQGDCIVEYQSTSGSWTFNNNTYGFEYEVEYYDGSTQTQTFPKIRIEGDLMYYRYTEVIENGEVVEYYDREFARVE